MKRLKNVKIPPIGISEIGIAIPKHFVLIEELAKKRKISPDYALKGLGVLQARIPYQISLEELAAESLSKINYQDIERFFIGTESDFDASKPLGVKILSQLGIKTVPFQHKFACLGGLQALISACEYTISHQGKPSVAIAVDRSLYQKNTPEAEITQGSAAIALRVEMNPKLLIVDYQNIGQYAEDIDDFKVPLFSFPFPQVNGELTKAAYLRCQKMALEDWKQKNSQFFKKIKNKESSLLDSFEFFIMHSPFPKMVEWAAAMFWKHENIKKEEHLSLSDCVKNPSLFKEYKKELDVIRKLPKFQEFFNKKVAPGLQYNPYIGNAYTGAIFISLISLLEKAKKNQQIGINGYGAGASSICVRTIFNSGKKFKSDIKKQIKKGVKLNISQYEKWREKTAASFKLPK